MPNRDRCCSCSCELLEFVRQRPNPRRSHSCVTAPFHPAKRVSHGLTLLASNNSWQRELPCFGTPEIWSYIIGPKFVLVDALALVAVSSSHSECMCFDASVWPPPDHMALAPCPHNHHFPCARTVDLRAALNVVLSLVRPKTCNIVSSSP